MFHPTTTVTISDVDKARDQAHEDAARAGLFAARVRDHVAHAAEKLDDPFLWALLPVLDRVEESHDAYEAAFNRWADSL